MGILTRSGQSATSGLSLPAVHSGPENYKVVHLCGSQIGSYARVVSGDKPPFAEAIGRSFQFARGLHQACGPVHFLVGISEGSDPAAAALGTGPGPSLRDVVAASGVAPGGGAGYLHAQAQQAALLLARTIGQSPGPGHLLIALLDQGTTEVVQALARAGLDPGAVRQVALAAIGAPAGQPPITLPALTPAGTQDRPPLPVADLDRRAWTMLRWRQDRLPLARLKRHSDWQALSHLEQNAAWRLAGRLGLDDDQRYSLISHHADQVERRIAAARPDLRSGTRRPGHPLGRRALLGVPVGWGVWCHNRWVDLRDCLFWLRTLGDYRGAPQP